SVVLPTPGGPQKIMECGRRASNATRKGLSGPSKCDCPMTSSILRGRSLSASGAFAPAAAPLNRSLSEKSLIDILGFQYNAQRGKSQHSVKRAVATAL